MQDILVTRYAGRSMAALFEEDHRYRLWRRLWLALAEAQKEVGIPIPDEAIAQMKAHLDEIDFDRVRTLERETKHDVMAHLLHFGELAPAARPFLHLGATSCFVTDNADLIIIHEALELIRARLAHLLLVLKERAVSARSIPSLGYTHFQVAQPTTVGKRFALYLQDFIDDYSALAMLRETLPLRGLKGTTGTQASFLALTGGDPEKVCRMESAFARRMEDLPVVPLTGQTYPRKIDWQVAGVCEGVALSAGKMSRDFRLLQHTGEMSEGRGKGQVGSSAMPYKQNPMKAERLTSLSRFLIHLSRNTADTAVEQWLERTLDDSANRRLVLPQLFLTTDAVLRLADTLVADCVIHEEVLTRRLQRFAPFLLVEILLMEGVKRGGDRQSLHETLRKYAMEAWKALEEGEENPFLGRVANDETLPFTEEEITAWMDPSALVGLAPQQVAAFVEDHAGLFMEAEQIASAGETMEV